MDPITLVVLIIAVVIAAALLIAALRMFGSVLFVVAAVLIFFWLWDSFDNPKQAEAQVLNAVHSTVDFAHQISDALHSH